jgi:hypothetical protein
VRRAAGPWEAAAARRPLARLAAGPQAVLPRGKARRRPLRTATPAAQSPGGKQGASGTLPPQGSSRPRGPPRRRPTEHCSPIQLAPACPAPPPRPRPSKGRSPCSRSTWSALSGTSSWGLTKTTGPASDRSRCRCAQAPAAATSFSPGSRPQPRPRHQAPALAAPPPPPPIAPHKHPSPPLTRAQPAASSHPPAPPTPTPQKGPRHRRPRGRDRAPAAGEGLHPGRGLQGAALRGLQPIHDLWHEGRRWRSGLKQWNWLPPPLDAPIAVSLCPWDPWAPALPSVDAAN